MTHLEVVSPAQWAAARSELAVQEAEEAKARQALSAARRRMPAIWIDKQYVLDGPNGKASLPELFEGRRQLVVYHFMFDPDWAEGCQYCSQIVDSIGHLAHLHALETTFAIVSRAPLAKIEAFRKRMGWAIPWYSASASDFNYDFQATVGESERGGMSVFLSDGEKVFQVYSAFDERVDLYLLDSSYINLAPLGLDTDQPQRPWPLHHDKYGA